MTSLRKKVLGSLTAAALSVVSTGSAFAEGPSFSGFIDTAYNYNLNGEGTNVLRTFDAKSNSFTLQNAEIVAEGKANEVGYRIDLDFGYDASLLNAMNDNDSTTLGDEVAVQQAFITAPCPLTGGAVTVGKFVTMHGAEVIEAKDNFNTSRGLLFNYAIPLHHTGVKYDKSFGDLAFTAGLVNGWDNVSDGNTGKTIHLMAAKPLGDKIKVMIGGAYGPEQVTQVFTSSATTVNGFSRSLVDAIVSFNPTSKLALVANADWGVEEGLVDSSGGTMNWAGLALLGKYSFSDKLAAALRYENFDDDGSRTGTEQVLNSVTATLECKKDGVITRFELRQDKSSDKVFVDDNLTPDDTQTTLGVQWIYAF